MPSSPAGPGSWAATSSIACSRTGGRSWSSTTCRPAGPATLRDDVRLETAGHRRRRHRTDRCGPGAHHVVYHLAAQASVVHPTDPLRDLAVNVIGTSAWPRRPAAADAAGSSSPRRAAPSTARRGERRRADAPAPTLVLRRAQAGGGRARRGLGPAIARSLRPSNIYGPRQAAGLEGAVIAAFVAQALEAAPDIDGDGRPDT